ncbi:MAG: hypothetical protein MI810_07275 [Flavobacteriales bacterium]|nr:hypothetical protein [Flavobacteriales bacterium]
MGSILLFGFGCRETQNSSKPQEDLKSDTSHTIVTSLDSAGRLLSDFKPEDMEYDSSEIELYPAHLYHLDKETQFGFVPLSDRYNFFNEEGSSVIDEEFLQTEDKKQNYHRIEGKYRSLLLERLAIEESDKIFIYHFFSDTLFSRKVSETPIVAFINPYGTSSEEILPYDFMFGFELDEAASKIVNYRGTLAMVEQKNSFVQGKIAPIEWKAMDPKDFPEVVISSEWDKKRIARSNSTNCYQFEMNGLKYMVQNWGSNQNLGSRHVVVRSIKTKKIVYSKFYHDSEGTFLEPLNGIEESYYPDHPAQWAGKLFKNKPPVVFGFLSHSFGCRSIHFLGESEEFVQLRCDNRH